MLFCTNSLDIVNHFYQFEEFRDIPEILSCQIPKNKGQLGKQIIPCLLTLLYNFIPWSKEMAHRKWGVALKVTKIYSWVEAPVHTGRNTASLDVNERGEAILIMDILVYYSRRSWRNRFLRPIRIPIVNSYIALAYHSNFLRISTVTFSSF